MQIIKSNTDKLNPIEWIGGHPYRKAGMRKKKVFVPQSDRGELGLMKIQPMYKTIDVPVYSTLRQGKWVFVSHEDYFRAKEKHN